MTDYIESVADFTPERADLSIAAPEPTPPARPTFDPAKIARIARGQELMTRRTKAEDAAHLVAAEAALAEEHAKRAEELHIMSAARRDEAEKYRKAEQDRIAEMDPAEIARRVRGRR